MCLDIPGALLQVGRGPPRDVDGGPGLAQLQGDAAPDPPGGSCDSLHDSCDSLQDSLPVTRQTFPCRDGDILILSENENLPIETTTK